MKVLLIVDSISKLNKKINLLTNRFGDNILFIVKANLFPIFKTYNYQANAIYNKNLTNVIHSLLPVENNEDIVVCYSSIELDDNLLNNFIAKIADRNKIVNVIPSYNFWENICNGSYNIYVKSLFKVKDSLASNKLQFLPGGFVDELMESHFGNRLFEFDEKYFSNLYIEKGSQNKSLKTKLGFNKFNLISIIIALVITIGLVLTLAFAKINYAIVLIFVLLYVLDLILTLIYQFKIKFDARYLK